MPGNCICCPVWDLRASVAQVYVISVGDEFWRLDPKDFCEETSSQHIALLRTVPIASSITEHTRHSLLSFLQEDSIKPKAAAKILTTGWEIEACHVWNMRLGWGWDIYPLLLHSLFVVLRDWAYAATYHWFWTTRVVKRSYMEKAVGRYVSWINAQVGNYTPGTQRAKMWTVTC